MRLKPSFRGFPGSPLVKTLPPHAGDMCSVPDQGTGPVCHGAAGPSHHRETPRDTENMSGAAAKTQCSQITE